VLDDAHAVQILRAFGRNESNSRGRVRAETRFQYRLRFLLEGEPLGLEEALSPSRRSGEVFQVLRIVCCECPHET
jgi:hypothetical protein